MRYRFDGVSGRLPMVFQVQNYGCLPSAIDKGLRHGAAVIQCGTEIEDVSPQLALIGYTGFPPLKNSGTSDLVSGLIFILGIIGVLLWGRR